MADAAVGAPSTSQTISSPGPAAPGVTASTGATGGSPTPSTESVNPGAWMAGFNDDLKGYVGTKGFKGPADVVDAYRNFEKMQGVPQDRIMKLPEKFYGDDGKLTPEGRSIYERLGTPKTAKDYSLPKPAQAADQKIMDRFSEIFHDAGIPQSAAEKIANSWNTMSIEMQNQMKEAQATAFKNDNDALTKEWGAAYDQNRNIAKNGMNTVGLTTQEVDGIAASIGHAKTMKMLLNLGRSVGESQFFGGKPAPSGIMEPAAAQAKIKELMNDTGFQKLINSRDSQALEKWTNLHKMAYQGDVNFR